MMNWEIDCFFFLIGLSNGRRETRGTFVIFPEALLFNSSSPLIVVGRLPGTAAVSHMLVNLLRAHCHLQDSPAAVVLGSSLAPAGGWRWGWTWS